MITILTPTYNRAYTLNRLYNSLCEQTNQRFDWLIIDDGSTDNTANHIKGMQKDQKLTIHYYYQLNSGKHVALNKGVKLSDKDWIFIVDSDDALTKDAIDTITYTINQYSTKKGIVGFCFRKAYFDNKMIGVEVQDDILSISPTEASQIYQGDLAYIFSKTSLVNNPFPIIENEKFVPELYIWNKIADQGNILFFSKKIVYLAEYLADGYTQNFKHNLQTNPQGFKLFYQDQLKREKGLKNKLKCLIRCWQCNRYASINKRKGIEKE